VVTVERLTANANVAGVLWDGRFSPEFSHLTPLISANSLCPMESAVSLED
jgi:hypothetical protein